jgi:hypothetical protein
MSEFGGNRWGSRVRSRAFGRIMALTASYLLFACHWAVAGSPKEKSYTARIVQGLDINDTSPAAWCGDTFVFRKDRTIFRYDTSGKLIWQTSAPWEMQNIDNFSCSVDGKVLYFTNSKFNRLSIYSVEDGLSEYAMSVPDLYNQAFFSLMSDDGSTFALPSVPSLISGKDVLRNKRVVQTDGASVYWTKDTLFIKADKKNHFRMIRSSDLSDLGGLELNPARGVQGIFECGKVYFVLYWKDELDRRDLEWINDRRLQSSGVRTGFDHVAGVNQFDGSCIVALEHDVAGTNILKSAVVLQDRVREKLNLPDARTLSPWLSISPDRRLILGLRIFSARLGNANADGTSSRVVMLRIE